MGLTLTRRLNEKIHLSFEEIKIDVTLVGSSTNLAQLLIETSAPIRVEKDGGVKDALEIIPCGQQEKFRISCKSEEIILRVIYSNDLRAKIDITASKNVLIERDNIRKDI